MKLAQTARELGDKVDRLEFSEPVAYVYNPLVYAWEPHQKYLERYGAGAKEVVFVGMNPGPFGMAQTGVPFGDVAMARHWLGIEGSVKRPPREHPKRPVMGFECERAEVSGSRFWGWARDRFGTPQLFFSRFFVLNYCPLVFIEESGRNRTPDKLTSGEKTKLFDACDTALFESVRALEARFVIGIGAFAEERIRSALGGRPDIEVGRVLHPSPASPVANRGWAERAEAQLLEIGVHLDM